MTRNTGLFIFILLLALVAIGCDDETGILSDPLAAPSYVGPTISNIQVQNTVISRCGGGIMRITCDWTSPYQVSTATAFLGFVKTIKNPVTEPIGVIGTQTQVLNYRAAIRYQVASDACPASDTAAFFQRYAEPIEIPTRIGTDDRAGRWEVDIPFAPEDTSMAPLGVYQMILYMKINHVKTNTLSFEMTFVP
jgi:hypothetical protein